MVHGVGWQTDFRCAAPESDPANVSAASARTSDRRCSRGRRAGTPCQPTPYGQNQNCWSPLSGLNLAVLLCFIAHDTTTTAVYREEVHVILCCGEALIDFIPTVAADGRECFLPAPGGCPYNTAIAAARLGVPTGFQGRVSSDMFGEQIVERLAANSVSMQHLARGDQPTTLAFVKRNQKGEARYAFFANGSADRSFAHRDAGQQLPREISCLMFGSISLLLEPGATTIVNLVRRETGKRVLSFDPNVRANLIADRPAYLERFVDLASRSTVVKISDADLAWLYPTVPVNDAAIGLVDAGACLVVVTMGENGSRAFSKRLDVGVPAVPVEVSDTVGAGDSYHAGLLAWLHDRKLLTVDAIAGLSAEQATAAMTFAAHVAAVTCSRAGADPAHRHELPQSLQ
ncbi:MAG: carbohydrate kinase [Spirochaetaceae bacterium]|nr:MAG: carbohydrate kinase [Spirochaetaceae bacterium]